MSQTVKPTPKPTPSPKKPAPPPQREEIEEGHELRMTLWEHLDELRKRFFWALISVVIGTAIGIALAGPLLEFLIRPYGHQLQVLGPTEGVVSYFRVSLLIGGTLAVPMITYQLLMFILPGLTNQERRILLMSLPAVSGLFVIGAGFAWFILVPPALGFLEGFQPTLFKPEWTADLYLSFITSLLFWMGVAFETPLVFFVLAYIGFVTPRALINNWRIAVIGAAVAAAIITPTVDPVNMFLVMGPLLALYGISIILVAIGRRIGMVRE